MKMMLKTSYVPVRFGSNVPDRHRMGDVDRLLHLDSDGDFSSKHSFPAAGATKLEKKRSSLPGGTGAMGKLSKASHFLEEL
jgi:hypothetical protein